MDFFLYCEATAVHRKKHLGAHTAIVVVVLVSSLKIYADHKPKLGKLIESYQTYKPEESTI